MNTPDINFTLRGVYSFEVYPTALIGTNFKNVTIMAIMDMETAKQYLDVVGIHIQVYPSLPPNTTNDPNSYDYVKIQTQTGQVTVLGMAWINASTVTQVTSSVVTATISNVSAADIPRIMNALVQNGYNDIQLTIK